MILSVKHFMDTRPVFRCAIMDNHNQFDVFEAKGLRTQGLDSLFKNIHLHIVEGYHHRYLIVFSSHMSSLNTVEAPYIL